MEERFYIPRTLDDPPLFFMFQFDDAMVFIACVVICALMGTALMFIVGIVLGMTVAKAYGRLKEEGGRGLLIRILYWYTPSEWWFRSMTPSHVREYIGG